MIPESRLSSQPVIGSFVDSFMTGDPLISIEYGGVALNDASQGLLVKPWTLRYKRDSGDVILGAAGVADMVMFTRADITQLSIAFDRNMQPVISFTELGQAKLYFFDDLTSQFVFWETELGDAIDPMVTHDDKRSTQSGISDVILGYVRGGQLRYRQQRDRYLVEITPLIGAGGTPLSCSRLFHVGMNTQWRLQFATDTGTDAPPFLADVVADLLRRSDVKPQHIDTSKLYPHTTDGYRIANEGGADSNIQPLQAAFFFDPSQWDKKLRFVPRGGEPVAHLTFDDLLEQPGTDGPLGIERVQQIELLRKVNVTMVDSTAGWITNKQTAERRLATIKAVGESSIVLPITAHPDFTATVATKRLRIPWGEPNKYKFGLGVKWSALTPADVVTMTDRKGNVYQMRLAQINEDYGNSQFETNSNASWIYKIQSKGVITRPSIPTVPGQAGDTVMVVLNIPVLRDGDDEFGYYVAVLGMGDGWRGGVAQMRVDDLGSPTRSIEVVVPSAVGSTLTALAPEVSSEYLSNQSVDVTLSEQPESISREAIFNMANLAAVQRADGSWEVLQYQTVLALGDNTYRLSGLVRGRYATEPLGVAVGGRFVLIDGTVTFVKLERWMLGRNINYRAISYGQNSDDVDWQVFTADDPKAQEEWAPHHLVATRDGSDNVTVTWIPRARLGVEVAPYQSKYFKGYQVIFSDGFTADVLADNTYTRASTPAGVTITVAGINDITGLGPESEGVTI